jgi:hypothetical protein
MSQHGLHVLASDAPINDLLLVSKVQQFSVINNTVSEAAMKKLENHLWYLGPEMIPLSLFSSKISSEEKKLIAESMVHHGADWSVRGIKYPAEQCHELQTKRLHELVTSASAAAINSLGLNAVVLASTDPDKWDTIPSYQQTAAVAKSIKVVNDCAERSIALMTSFNQSITRTESEMQKLMQVVEDNRSRISDTSKHTLKTYMTREVVSRDNLPSILTDD